MYGIICVVFQVVVVSELAFNWASCVSCLNWASCVLCCSGKRMSGNRMVHLAGVFWL